MTLQDLLIHLPEIIALFAGLFVGWLFTRVYFSGKLADLLWEKKTEASALKEKIINRSGAMDDLQKQLHDREMALQSRTAELMEMTGRHGAAVERATMLEQSGKTLAGMFESLSAGALRDNNKAFMDLAKSTLSGYLEEAGREFDSREQRVKNIVQPVREALDRYDSNIKAMELAREKAYGGLSSQVLTLADAHRNLHKETGNLVKALRAPHVRGRWGELTLRRVVELAGMTNRCDFMEQATVASEKGTLRPDMVVRLPGNHNVVVDAKAPIYAYLESLDSESENQRRQHLADHAKHLATHITLLSKKSYWKQFTPTPEFVVLFIPGENFFSAALTENPRLIENAAEKGVVLATPTTLISLLKAVSYGWQRETSEENAMAVSKLGHELYGRLSSMVGHMDKLGRDIDKCASTYNQTIGSLERRVLVSARRLDDLGISMNGDKKLPSVRPVDNHTRRPVSNEDKEPYEATAV